MLNTHPAINSLVERYFACAETPFDRNQYFDAILQLDKMFKRLDEDLSVLFDIVDCLLTRYDDLKIQVENFAKSQDYDKLLKTAELLQSQMNLATSQSKIQIAADFTLATQAKDYTRIYMTWLKLHTKISPLMTVFRRFRDSVRDDLQNNHAQPHI